MKRILITLSVVLLLVGSTFAQKQSDKFYEAYLTQIRKIPIDSDAARNVVLKNLNKTIDEMGESSNVKRLYTNYINEIQSLSFTDGKSRSIDVLSKDDLKGLEVKQDKFTGITHIRAKDYNLYPLSAYLKIDKENRLFMNLIVNYRGSGGWIFMDKMIVLARDKSYTYNFKNMPRRETTGGSSVQEQLSEAVSPELLDILDNIVISDTPVEVRLSGENYVDRKISTKNVDLISKVLSIYDKLKVD